MSELDTRLREALRGLAPDHLATEGLADGARRYAARTRRVRRVGLAGATAVAVVLAALLVSSFQPPDRVVPAGPFLTPADCTRQAASAKVPAVDGESTMGVAAAWVCPDGPEQTGPAGGIGWRLPKYEVTAPHLEGLQIDRSTDAYNCGGVRPGPPFTVTLATESGQLTTFRSRDLGCDGVYTLASFLDAMAGEEVDAQPESRTGLAPACRTEGTWLRTHPTRSLAQELHSPLVVATLCLAPNFVSGDPRSPIQPMTARSYRAIPVPTATLALLNADLTSDWGGSFAGNGACSPEGSWSYAIVGRTSAGDERMLHTACLDELWVTGVNRTGLIPSATTSAAIASLVPPT